MMRQFAIAGALCVTAFLLIGCSVEPYETSVVDDNRAQHQRQAHPAGEVHQSSLATIAVEDEAAAIIRETLTAYLNSGEILAYPGATRVSLSPNFQVAVYWLLDPEDPRDSVLMEVMAGSPQIDQDYYIEQIEFSIGETDLPYGIELRHRKRSGGFTGHGDSETTVDLTISDFALWPKEGAAEITLSNFGGGCLVDGVRYYLVRSGSDWIINADPELWYE